MIKSTFAALAATPFLASAAFAGPYVNIENNAGFVGSDFGGSATDFHVSYGGESGALGYYIQGGPTIVAIDGADTETGFSGKVGGSVAATENLSVYGELSMNTAGAGDNGYGTKVGVTWSF